MDDAASLHEFARIGEVAETTTQLLALGLQHHTTFAGRPRGRTRPADPVELYVFQQARDLMAQVREGFVLSVRSSQAPTKAELRFLLDRVLHDWQALSTELGLEDTAAGRAGRREARWAGLAAGRQTGSATADQTPSQSRSPTGSQVESPAGAGTGSDEAGRLQDLRHQLLAFGMAATALGLLPRTPAEEITFPYSFGQPPTYGDIPAPATPGEMLVRIEELERMLWQLMAADLQEIVNHQYGPLRRTYGFFEVSARLANCESRRFGVKRPTQV